MKYRKILGVDFGGSGIKGAPVDTKKGELLAPRYRIETPTPATPDRVLEVISQLVKHFKWEGPVGLAFPAVVLNGIVKTAANIDKSWVGIHAAELIKEKTGLPTWVVNDADAAGMAEMKYGAGMGHRGSVLLITVGTGIGTVLFSHGKLVPNTEFGHIYLNTGEDAETVTSDAVRQNDDLSWEEWAVRLNNYLNILEKLLYPELIIIGGGMSKRKEKFMEYLTIDTKVVMAKTKNEAGIIGAALYAKSQRSGKKK